MAAFTSKATGNWTATGQTTWNEEGFPATMDTVTIQNGHVVTLDAFASFAGGTIAAGGELTDVATNNGFTSTGAIVVDGTLTCGTVVMSFTNLSGSGTVVIGDGRLSASGVITLDNMTVTTGDATITGDVNLGDVGGVGTLTMSDTLTINGGFLLDGGTLTMATNKMSVSGSWINASGTLATPGTVEMTGTGNITTNFGTLPDRLELTSTANVTAVSSMRVKNGFKGAEESVFNIGAVAVRLCDGGTDATDIVESLGTFTRTTGSILMLFGRDISNSLVMDLGDIPVTWYSSGALDRTWTQSGRYESGDLWTYSVSATYTTTLNLTGNSVIGDIILGFTSADRSAAIDFNSGVHTIGSITMGHDDNENNAIALASCTLECTGAFNADNIAVSASAALAPRLIFIAGGVLSNIDDKGLDNPIAVWGDASVLGAGTTDNDVDTYGPNYQTYPGSMLTMGVGGGHGAVSF